METNRDRTNRDRTELDPRVPPLVALPQLAATLMLAGDLTATRIGFLLAVAGNVPVALAGRLVATLPSDDLSRARALLEWIRPCAAWAYALLLAALLPYVDVSQWSAVLTAAGANTVAGALMYVLPGETTPAGLRLRQRELTGAMWRYERQTFVASRLAKLLFPAAGVLLVTGRLLLAALCLWGGGAAALLAYTLPPRNAAGPDSSIREKEKIR